MKLSEHQICYRLHKIVLMACILLLFQQFVMCNWDNTLPSITKRSSRYIPSVTYETFNTLFDTETSNKLDVLKDAGGKLSTFVITELGTDYQEALEKFHKEAPNCIKPNGHIQIPDRVQLPDGSFRQTYATESKTFPECLNSMGLLSRAFDDIDEKVAKLLSKFNNNHELQYISGDTENVPICHAPIKDHIHVYTKGHKSDDHKLENVEKEYLVPYHVDNGIYLLLTPFPHHGLEVQLSDGERLSTTDISSDSLIVLMGRGLTDWLLQLSKEKPYFATPHAVPSLAESHISSRSVYARMKVAPGSAIPSMIEITQREGEHLKPFQEIFMERGASSQNNEVTNNEGLCSVDLTEGMSNQQNHGDGKNVHHHKEDMMRTADSSSWSHAMDHLCDAGQAYCWMSCRPLPASCPSVEKAECYSTTNNITCG